MTTATTPKQEARILRAIELLQNQDNDYKTISFRTRLPISEIKRIEELLISGQL